MWTRDNIHILKAVTVVSIIVSLVMLGWLLMIGAH